jgi:cytidine deaminase
MNKDLRQAAIAASKMAHAPYSTAQVGSALMTSSGEIISGCNIENSSFGGTVCAERVAMWKAVSEGKLDWSSIYVYTKEGWSPCGLCRQVMVEFAPKNLKIIIGNEKGIETEHLLEELLPLAFSPKDIK